MEGSTCSLSSSLSLATFLSFLICSSCSAARVTPGKSSIEFIRTSCGVTSYPQVCIQSLSGYASKIQSSPTELARTALSVSLTGARCTSAMISKLSAGQGMKPREVAATSDCVENIGDAIDELQRSLGGMTRLRKRNFGLQMNDIQTWVSAALTEEDTCIDGFAGKAMNGNAQSAVRSRILNLAHMTSNALALINSLASIHATSP